MTTILNPGQQKAVDKMQKFLKDTRTSGEHFVLTGGPGTGKTFLTKYAIGSLKYDYRIAGATISHAAKTILQEHVGRVKCFTLASLLGLTMQYDKFGNMLFKENSKSSKPISRFDAILLDEISMIDDFLYDKIMLEADNNNIKIIAIGDRYQLPPVEQEHDSLFFNRIDAELTQPMRFTGPIGTLSDIYKQEIKKFNEGGTFNKWALNSSTNRVSMYDNTINSGYKFLNKIWDVIEMAADSIVTNKEDKNFARILAFKNDSVDKLNIALRSIIYGKNVSEFEDGELLILNSSYYGGSSSPALYNGEIIRVKSYIEDIGPYDIPCARLKLYNFNHPMNAPIYAILKNNPKSIDAYVNKERKLKQNAISNPKEWETYSEFIGQFANFNYAYAVNLYRA